MLPIEEGCEAVVVRGVMTGTPVHIGARLDNVKGFVKGVRYEVDKLMPTTKGKFVLHQLEEWMMRIDGGEFEEEETQELALVLVNSGDNHG